MDLSLAASEGGLDLGAPSPGACSGEFFGLGQAATVGGTNFGAEVALAGSGVVGFASALGSGPGAGAEVLLVGCGEAFGGSA